METEFEVELDISLIEHNLSLPPEKRLEEHERALNLLWELEEAHKKLYEEPE